MIRRYFLPTWKSLLAHMEILQLSSDGEPSSDRLVLVGPVDAEDQL
jgi:hypothetical protein